MKVDEQGTRILFEGDFLFKTVGDAQRFIALVFEGCQANAGKPSKEDEPPSTQYNPFGGAPSYTFPSPPSVPFPSTKEKKSKPHLLPDHPDMKRDLPYIKGSIRWNKKFGGK